MSKDKAVIQEGVQVHEQKVAAQPSKPLTGTQPIPYIRKSQGYPTEPGQTWHDLTPAQREQWMRNHENRWKQRFNQGSAGTGGMQPDMNWTRG